MNILTDIDPAEESRRMLSSTLLPGSVPCRGLSCRVTELLQNIMRCKPRRCRVPPYSPSTAKCQPSRGVGKRDSQHGYCSKGEGRKVMSSVLAGRFLKEPNQCICYVLLSPRNQLKQDKKQQQQKKKTTRHTHTLPIKVIFK